MTGNWSDLSGRLLTSVIALPAIVVIILAGPTWVLAIVIAGTGAIAALEFLELSQVRRRHITRATVFIAAAAVPFAALWYVRWSTAATEVALAVVGVAVLGALTAELAIGRVPSWARSPVPATAVAVLYCGFLLSFLIVLHGRAGSAWVVLALAVAWGSDVGGYLAGRAFGRHPLAAALSERKTVEGAVGALTFGVGAAVLVGTTSSIGLNLGTLIALSLVASAFGQVGDLWESRVKRTAGVRHSGRLLPGGGALDHIDSLIFAAPTLFAGFLVVR